MSKAVIDVNKCDFAAGCPARLSCPEGAIKRGQNSYEVDEERCNGCGSCVYACPHRAINI